MARRARRWWWTLYLAALYLSPTVIAVCEIEGGDTVIIMDIRESIGNQTDQGTHPRDLPIVGDVQDIDLSIQSSTYDVFDLLGKRLVLKRPLDRDVSYKQLFKDISGKWSSFTMMMHVI